MRLLLSVFLLKAVNHRFKTKVCSDSICYVSGNKQSPSAVGSAFVHSGIYVHNFSIYCVFVEPYPVVHSHSSTAVNWVRKVSSLICYCCVLWQDEEQSRVPDLLKLNPDKSE